MHSRYTERPMIIAVHLNKTPKVVNKLLGGSASATDFSAQQLKNLGAPEFKASTTELGDLFGRMGGDTKKLNDVKKGIESKILNHAFLEFVRNAANPILKKKKIAVKFLNKLFVFSNKNAIENGHTKLSQAPA